MGPAVHPPAGSASPGLPSNELIGHPLELLVQVSFGSPGRGHLGGVGDHVDLSGLPRNFSLSDLALDQVTEGEHGLPHNISLSDLPAFDIDSGGE